MNIDVNELSQNQAYFTLTQTILPRPVAWVLSEHENGQLNLAPFSYFTPVCSNPPLVMFSVGRKPDGTLKDTCRNILERKHFVIHLAQRELAEEVTRSARSLAAGESELELCGLGTVPFEGWSLPRLVDSRVAFGCELFKVEEIGDGPQYLVFGRIRRIWLDDDVASIDKKGRLHVDASGIDPLGRLGRSEYTALGEILDIPRDV
ncbi:MAG: flavin reductase family protein [Marinobacterium sp.]|nr:flavin reductase family protein [Marinobacterium sp.]